MHSVGMPLPAEAQYTPLPLHPTNIITSQCAFGIGCVTVMGASVQTEGALRSKCLEKLHSCLKGIIQRLISAFKAMLSALIYGTASAAQNSETGGGWGTKETHGYIRSFLKVRRRDNSKKRTGQMCLHFRDG